MDSQVDDKIINELLNSNDLKDIVKSLVKSESKSKRPNDSAINKLAELLNKTNIHEHNRSTKNKSTMPINDIKSDSLNYSENEKIARCTLASLFRLLDMEGWTRTIFNMISLRFENYQLMNPFGLLYHEVTATSLIKVNENDQIINPGCTTLKMNQSNHKLHQAIYKHRPDINCIVQINIPDVVAVSSMKSGLLACSKEGARLLNSCSSSLSGGAVTYHQLKSQDIGSYEQLLNDLGNNSRIIFIRNAGVIICAPSIPEAWLLTKTCVSACQNQIRLLQLCGKDILNGDNCNELDTSFGLDCKSEAELEFEAMMRLLDNAGYRTGYKYQNLKKGGGTGIRLGAPRSQSKIDDCKKVLDVKGMDEVTSHGDSATTDEILMNGDANRIHLESLAPTNLVEQLVNQVEEEEEPAVDSEEEREFVKGICSEIIDKSIQIVQENPTENHSE